MSMLSGARLQGRPLAGYFTRSWIDTRGGVLDIDILQPNSVTCRLLVRPSGWTLAQACNLTSAQGTVFQYGFWECA